MVVLTPPTASAPQEHPSAARQGPSGELGLWCRCRRVVRRLSLVVYQRGLTGVGPDEICDDCLSGIREEELASAAGRVRSSADYVWACQVLEVREMRAAAAGERPLRAQTPRPRRAAGTVEL